MHRSTHYEWKPNLLQAAVHHRRRSYWTLQLGGWLGFACFVMFCYWPDLNSPAARWAQALKIFLSFLLSLPLHAFCRFFWKKESKRTPSIVAVVASILSFAVLTEFSVELFTHALWNAPSRLRIHIVVTSSLLYQFALAGWCACYFALKWIVQIEEQTVLMHQSLLRAREAQIASFRYQIPTEFLMKTLDEINALISGARGRDARQMITQLGSLLRSVLESPGRSSDTLAAEIWQVQEYLEIQKKLSGKRVSVFFDVDTETFSALIPRWFFIPLLEDITSSLGLDENDESSLTLSIRRSGERLIVTLKWEGNQVYRPKILADFAFAASKERLRTLYGEEASLSLGEESGCVLFSMEMPIGDSQRLVEGSTADADTRESFICLASD